MTLAKIHFKTNCLTSLFVSHFNIADAANCKDKNGDGYYHQDGCGTLQDCNDNDPGINPGADDVYYAVDNNCDGIIDEDFDSDGHSYSICDGKDSDCDGWAAPNDVDKDGDGYAVCAGDCNDIDPSVHPGAMEGPLGDPTCSDSKDNDCNGLFDNC